VSGDVTPFHFMSLWYADGQLYIHFTVIRSAFCSRVTGSKYLRKELADSVFPILTLTLLTWIIG
jgi:hypothetical protein